ncbi:hypothetical protein RIF29_17467 [Crotalaria pallida]|uniref:Uncharacterized protein n=1 Tax=Crotalaria pallida TaxID=3830 RepID=A0AAN9FP25_CROPI
MGRRTLFTVHCPIVIRLNRHYPTAVSLRILKLNLEQAHKFTAQLAGSEKPKTLSCLKFALGKKIKNQCEAKR